MSVSTGASTGLSIGVFATASTHSQATNRFRDCVVLKFGSSVLPSEAYLAHAVHEVYRYVREGKRVIAVVSALGTTTNHLLAHAARYGRRVSEAGLAALAATGEARAAALLTLALDRAGVPAGVLDAGALGLTTIGPARDASLASLDEASLERALAREPVLVVPGFIGRDEDGRATLLGRGGSDFTAAFIASRLGVDCILVKDVDALFDRDPAIDPVGARRLTRASYGDVLGLSEGIVQHKAVRFVRDHGATIRIARVGHDAGTVVDHGPAQFGESGVAPSRRPLRVALLGLGTVGRGVYEHLDRLGDLFEVTRVVVRDTARAEQLVRGSIRVDGDVLDAARHEDCDVIVEALGGVEPALTATRAALSRGVHVVSANKAAIAADASGLVEIARRAGARVAYSAAVGGGVPVLERVREIARGEGVVAVEGVLNGTCNFVLDRVGGGATLEAAVRDAQSAGFAEADASVDLDGIDAAHKLVLIAHAAWGAAIPVESVAQPSVRSIGRREAESARERGCVHRAVASVRRETGGGGGGERIEAKVEVREVDRASAYAHAIEEDNCVTITTASGATHVLRGRGAGQHPTAESVLGDLLALSREVRRG
jgi:homoserine dehydrogenase